MKARVIDSRLRVVPRDVLLYEDVQVGDVQVREMSTHLNMEVTIAIDRPEIEAIAKLPDIAGELKTARTPSADAPSRKAYSGGDWRAKVPEIRKAQYLQRPVIDYIIRTYEEYVLGAAVAKFSSVPEGWQQAIFGSEGQNVEYTKDPKALQLSSHSTSDIATAKKQGKEMWPDNTGKWRFIYVNVMVSLGDMDDKTSFFGKLAQEIRAAVEAGQITKVDDKTMQIQTTLTGFDSALRELDPYSGKFSSDAKIGIYDIADEPGYDLEVRSGFIDRISEIISFANDSRITNLQIDDNGLLTFNASAYQRPEMSDQDDIAATMEPGAEEELPPEEPEELEPPVQESKEVQCSNCKGTGDVVGRGPDGERAWLICQDCRGTGKRVEY